jgi:hypothetical protein
VLFLFPPSSFRPQRAKNGGQAYRRRLHGQQQCGGVTPPPPAPGLGPPWHMRTHNQVRSAGGAHSSLGPADAAFFFWEMRCVFDSPFTKKMAGWRHRRPTSDVGAYFRLHMRLVACIPKFYLVWRCCVFFRVKFDIGLAVRGSREDRWVRNRLCCSGAEAPPWQRWAWPQLLCDLYPGLICDGRLRGSGLAHH